MTKEVEFDAGLGASFIRYAHMVARRGYVHNTLGNMVIRKSRIRYRGQDEIDHMFRFAERVIYPDRAEGVMAED